MIPAHRLRDNGDGTYWLIYRPGVDPMFRWKQANRPCDTCGGRQRVAPDRETEYDEWLRGPNRPCPDCINGRHTFPIEVEGKPSFWSVEDQAKYQIEPCDDEDCCERPPRSLRVSVVPNMVLEIVDQQSTRTTMTGRWIARVGDAWRFQECDGAILTTRPDPIDLPDGDLLGMWAALLQTEKQR